MKEYLGDSVYVEVERGMLKLTTDNGFGASNMIFLEAEVYYALNRYVANKVIVSLERDSPKIVERESSSDS
jgi:hypothetical protein